MFKTVVWATDGSEHADRALPLVTGLARAHRSKIVAVYASGPMLNFESETTEKIERQVEELRSAGFVAELRIVRGLDGTAAQIAHAAQSVDAELIVVGSHGHNTIASALLGSVARGLLHEAHCPVLVSRPQSAVAA
jgi:nucleotide-binding universal stress UspA family protein